MVENGRWKKFGFMEILILTMMSSVGFGLIAYAVFLYFGMQQAYIVLGGGFLLMASMIWWRFIRCRTQ